VFEQRFQINRTTKFVRSIRVTSQGEWEWEESSRGSGDWKAYGATEATELKSKYQSTVKAMRCVYENRVLEKSKKAAKAKQDAASAAAAAKKAAAIQAQAAAAPTPAVAAAAAPGAVSSYLVITSGSTQYDVSPTHDGLAICLGCFCLGCFYLQPRGRNQ